MSERRSRARRRFVAGWLVVLVAAGCLWWGVHPPRTVASYREQSASTLDALHSQVETTRMWLDAVDRDRVTSAAAEVALTETESDASTQVSTYSAYQPPHQLVDLRTRVTGLGDRVVSLLGEVRIAARAGRWSATTDLRSRLSDLSDQLLDVRREVRP